MAPLTPRHFRFGVVAPQAPSAAEWKAIATGGFQATAAIVRRFGLDLETAVATRAPNVLVGSASAMTEQVEERRATVGLSYVVVGMQNAETFAPVVQRRAGS
jgi:hypothetical protein